MINPQKKNHKILKNNNKKKLREKATENLAERILNDLVQMSLPNKTLKTQRKSKKAKKISSEQIILLFQ